VRDVRASSDREVDKASIRGIDETYQVADDQFAVDYPDDPTAAAVAGAFFRAIFQYSYEFMEDGSRERWSAARARVSLTEGAVAEGEIIVRSGDRITGLVQRKLSSLERSQALRTGNRIGWKTRLGQTIVTLATFFFFFLYLYFLRRKVFDSNRMLFLVALLFAGIIGLYAFVLRTEFFGFYIVPVAIVSILLTVIFDSRVALFGTLTLALIGGLLLRYDFEFLFATIFAGGLGIYSVRDIKNRGQFFVSSGLVFLGYATILFGSLLIHNTSTDNFLSELLQVGVNSFLLIIAYPLLWVFERAFDITTDLTLLELSDTNRPLLKELSIRAPGTLNHTLQVANLAEAAADRVNANALLTRVGALYHDIGKMNKPEYFVENQRAGINPHDNLKPRMSALIIASHVKEGLEIGRMHNLPQRVLDFIPMHHGTAKIEYFYKRALDDAAEGDAPVSESEFRYPGPKPSTREAGILMLADSVEAASRSIGTPTHKRFEGLIDSIFSSRMEDGQLDDVDLTLRELNVIKETFLNMLVGMHHVRVKYPGQEEEVEEDDDAVVPVAGSVAAPIRHEENVVTEALTPIDRQIE
jgi:putative nucleotidyltransferase with HDIG domain